MGAKAYIVEKTEGFVKRWDGWINALTGANIAGMDVRVNSIVEWKPMSETESAYLYAADSMAAKLVDKPVDHSLQAGYKWTGITEEEGKKLDAKLSALQFDTKLMEAWKKARMTGGAGIFKLYDDILDVKAPSNPAAPKPIKSLITLNRFELSADWEDCQKSVLSPNFGLPVLYTFQGRSSQLAGQSQLKIHYTRIVRFVGVELPDILKTHVQQWGDSVMNRPKDAIRNFSHAHDSINQAIKDLSVAVFKVKGLANMLDSNDDAAITNRLKAVNLAKSIARAVIVDADGEDFDYRTRSLTGAAELVKLAADRMVAETDMPRTVLMGDSPPGGLGQSGNHEYENWYSVVESMQKNYLKPKMIEIAKEVCFELGIKSASLDIEFNKLWVLSEKESADIKNIMAQVDEKYHNMGVLDTYEITEARFGSGVYSIETQVDMETRTRQEQPANLEEPGVDPNDPKLDGGPGSGPRPGNGPKKEPGKKNKTGKPAAPSSEEASAIRFYTGSQSADFIAHDQGKGFDAENGARNEKLNKYLEKSPKYSGTIQRGISVEGSDAKDVLAKYQPGATIELESKQSWTKDEKNVQDRLTQVSKGQKNPTKFTFEYPNSGVGVDISEHSRFPEEAEVLVPKGASYKVKEVQPVNGGFKIIFE